MNPTATEFLNLCRVGPNAVMCSGTVLNIRIDELHLTL